MLVLRIAAALWRMRYGEGHVDEDLLTVGIARVCRICRHHSAAEVEQLVEWCLSDELFLRDIVFSADGVLSRESLSIG